jgi:hypothetical protein
MLQAKCPPRKGITETETGALRKGEKRSAAWLCKETYMETQESM